MADSFERLIARAERQDAAGRNGCPNAEALAAYLDGGLSSSERRIVERHAAGCTRCALHLATVVRLEDESGHPQPAAPAGLPWWRQVRWVVPATMAALVVAVWIAVPLEQSSLPGDAGERLQSSPAQEAPEQSDAATPQEPAAYATRPPGPDGNGSAPANAPPALADTARPQSAPPASAGTPSGRARTGDARSDGALDRSPQTRAEAYRSETGRAVTQSVPAAPPPAAPAAADRDTREEPAGPKALAKSAPALHDTGDEEQETAPPAEALSTDTAAAAPARERQSPAARGTEATGAAAGAAVRAIGGGAEWRVRGDRIERSTDAGRTWTGDGRAPGEALTTGSAPSASVCWLAGDGGVVLRRTADGEWMRVPLPEPLPIARVEAIGALDATVTTASGRRFVTRDGGATWTEF